MPPGYISSEQMTATPNAEQLISIGKKIVEDLKLDRSDTLCQWIAHHIAELMDREASASGEAKNEIKAQCLSAILKLWSHRASLPDGARPFESFEPILRALKSLDPDNTEPRYHRTILAMHPDVNAPPEPRVRSLFEFVRVVDDAARTIIGHALAEAAEAASDKDDEWVTLAQDAADDGGVHILLIRYTSKTGDHVDGRDKVDEVRRAILSDRIQRLETFIGAAKDVVDALKIEIEALPSAPTSIEESL
jgi:hypothetical protein